MLLLRALIYLTLFKSGYRVTSLPLYTESSAPSPPQDVQALNRPNTEPIYTTIMSYDAVVRRGRMIRPPGEYLVFWFVGQIPENAVCLIEIACTPNCLLKYEIIGP